MAAVLKRRALAEFSRVIQQDEEKKPAKKLKLVQRPVKPEPQIDLSASLSPQDILNILLQLESQFPLEEDHVENVIRTLLDHLYAQKATHVKAKVIDLLGKLAQSPSYDATALLDSLCSLAKTESSHKVLAELVTAIEIIGKSMIGEIRTVNQLVQVAKQLLKDGSHLVRSRCLHLIGCLGSPSVFQEDGDQSDARSGLFVLLGQYANDIDPRVRESAYEAILEWHKREFKLESHIYPQLVTALSDDYEGVRVTALKLLKVIAGLYPENKVPVSNSEEDIRLVDDAFAMVCDRVSDVSMRVRATAAGLLGEMVGVSQKFLEQTLDKKLMSNMRRKTSAHERQKEHFQSGVWSTGQKWADDAPKEELDAEAVSLMSSGACGAFVHGLEDEFLEVRTASIDSICSLAINNYSFANLCQDFLVDMFNDEIESVRLNAIECLSKIGHHISLREDQLDIILGVLKDFSYDIRDALKVMLCSNRMATKGALNACIMGLLENMKTYPQDRVTIWKSMQQIGQKHPALILSLVPELLSIHPYFDTPEPDMDDPAYIAVLILVFNAAKDNPTMPTLLPDHAIRHYIYISDTLQDLVPKLRMPDVPIIEVTENNATGVCASQFLETTLNRLRGLPDMEVESALQLIKLGIRDLKRICQIEAELGPVAECLSRYLQCQSNLTKIASEYKAAPSNLISPQQLKQQKALLDQVIENTQHMESLYVGFSVAEILNLRQLQLLARGLCLQMSQVTGMSTFKRQTKEFVSYLAMVENDLSESGGISLLPFTQCLIDGNLSKDTESTSVLKLVHKAVQLFEPTVLSISTKLTKSKVEIIEPSCQSDNTLSFTAGLALGIPFIANIENVNDISSLRFKIKYPDQHTQLVVPRLSHVRKLKENHARINTQVLLSHSVWSESNEVEISLVKCFCPSKPLATSDESEEMKSGNLSKNGSEDYVELCAPVKLSVAPKSVKR